jgi:alanine dehydrogenase
MTQTIGFGLVRETLPTERRVALTPQGVEQLIALGHAVILESGAGADAGFTDDDYLAVGATLCLSETEVVSGADVLVKIHGPLENEHNLLREGGTITGFMHLFSPESSALRNLIREHKVNAIAWELLEENDGSRPVLEAVSAIGGRVAILLAAEHLLSSNGGTGRLLGGAPGVPPLNVVVIGAGAAGEAAAREAQRMGAQVTVLDQDSRALTRVDRRINGIVTAIASVPHLDNAIARADLLVTAVANPGRPAPQIVTRRQVRSMPQDAMIIDMSVDEGGCCETTRQETKEGTYIEEGVRHLCVPNLPSEVAQTASIAFTNATLPYLIALGEAGVKGAVSAEPALYRGAVYVAGVLRNSVIAEFTGEPLGQ